MSTASGPIPFGYPITKTPEGTWRMASHSEMMGVALRPTWANSRRGDYVDNLVQYERGEEVEIRAEGKVLMIFADKDSPREGVIVLAGQTDMVELHNGRIRP